MNSSLTPRKFPLRAHRLGSPDMYRRVKTEGAVLRKFPFSMRYLQAEDIREDRIGFVIRKKTGNAPLRNAMRRVLRELFRELSPTFSKRVWVVFDVADKASETTRSEFRARAAALLASFPPAAA